MSVAHRAVLSSRKPQSGCPGPKAIPSQWVPARARLASLAGMTSELELEFSYDFNNIKYFLQTIFPFQNSFLHWPNDPWHTHAPDFSRRRSGAFARAKNAVRGQSSKKFSKTDEQFCCRSSARTEPRQPERLGRPAAQSECRTTRQAFGRTTGPSRRSQIDDPLCERALRAGEGFAQSASGVPT